MKITMRVKKTEWIDVEVSEETGFDMVDDQDTLQAKFDFAESVKEDFRTIAEEDDNAITCIYTEWDLEEFKVEE